MVLVVTLVLGVFVDVDVLGMLSFDSKKLLLLLEGVKDDL